MRIELSHARRYAAAALLLATLTIAPQSTLGATRISVGISDNPPMAFMGPDGKARGIFVEILEHIAKQESWQTEYLECARADCLEKLEAGEFDILAAVAATPQRTMRFTFNREKILVNWGVVYAQTGSAIDTLFDLNEKTVAVVKSDQFYGAFWRLTNQFSIRCNFLEVGTYAEVIERVSLGEADAGVVNRLFSGLAQQNFPVQKSPIIFSPVELGFATAFEAPTGSGYLETIDKNVEQLKADKNSRYYQVLEKWIVNDIPTKWLARLKWLLLAALAALLLLGAGYLLLRVQVRAKTRELRHSEARFRDFAQAAADFFWETDVDLKLSYLSGRVGEVTGHTPESLLGRNISAFGAASIDDNSDALPLQEQLEARQSVDDRGFSITRPDRTVSYVRISGRPVVASDGQFNGYRGTGHDITEAYRLSKRLSYEATHDPLTGLVNRRYFEIHLKHLLDTINAGDVIHAMCYIDLDQFKVINDTCGHAAGDELLRQLAGLLRTEIRQQDTLARLGGDEFGLLLEHCSLERATQIAEGLREAIEEFRFSWGDGNFKIGGSIGLVPITESSESVTAIMSAADSACYAAKDAGRNRVHLFHEDDVELSKRHGEMQWVARINRALEYGSFQLSLQPIVPTGGANGEGEHYELLIRMVENGEVVPPGAFLPAAERYGLAPKIDRWVIETASAWLRDNPEHLENLHLCGINLSGLSLGDEKFLDFVTQAFDDTSVPWHKICLEVTETAAIANLTNATRFIHALKKRGCQFALDDFGSGLSSFAYLKHLPVDYLKIDGVFVKDLVDNPIDRAMVRSIHDIGQVMGMRTIAEFVENDAILERLRDIGVDYAQGYGVGRPRPINPAPKPDP